MASLSPPFILCPLPDRKALLGIRQDREANKAIVTLGRNIAIRYHVLEQKQECSWTTSRYWFTSPVTFCYDQGKYGAVLNSNIVALWDETDTTLSNISKFKLPESIHGIHSSPKGCTIIVMKNGHVVYMSDVLKDKSRVKTRRLDAEESLLDFEVDETNRLCYLVSGKANCSKSFSITVTETEKSNSTGKCIIGSEKHDMLGYCISAKDSDSFVVYYGSDGCMYKRMLTQPMVDAECVRLANLSKAISNKNPVVMCPLPDNSCIAMYGSDPSEEGAVVLIYDIQYDLVISKQSLKLYSLPPLMERIGYSLFVPLGLHILVLTIRVTKSLLSSVIGRHQAKLNEEVFEGRNPWATKEWNSTSTTALVSELKTDKLQHRDEGLGKLKKAYPKIWEIVQQVQIFESEGQPEAVICNHVVPDALEKNNGPALDWILDTFLDIPEVHIVSMINYSLGEVDVVSDQRISMSGRLNKLLLRKFSKNLLSMSLRHLSYEDVKKLLTYINHLVKTQWQLDVDMEDNNPMQLWLKWCSALVDAHYTKFVLHNDTVIIDDLLDSMSECTQLMREVEDLEPYLLMTYSKTSFEPAPDTLKRWRTETINFE